MKKLKRLSQKRPEINHFLYGDTLPQILYIQQGVSRLPVAPMSLDPPADLKQAGGAGWCSLSASSAFKSISHWHALDLWSISSVNKQILERNHCFDAGTKKMTFNKRTEKKKNITARAGTNRGNKCLTNSSVLSRKHNNYKMK